MLLLTSIELSICTFSSLECFEGQGSCWRIPNWAFRFLSSVVSRLTSCVELKRVARCGNATFSPMLGITVWTRGVNEFSEGISSAPDSDGRSISMFSLGHISSTSAPSPNSSWCSYMNSSSDILWASDISSLLSEFAIFISAVADSPAIGTASWGIVDAEWTMQSRFWWTIKSARRRKLRLHTHVNLRWNGNRGFTGTTSCEWEVLMCAMSSISVSNRSSAHFEHE